MVFNLIKMIMSFENETTLTFEQLPQAVATLIEEVRDMKELLSGNVATTTATNDTDRWFTVKELCNYLPTKSKPQTVYGWRLNKLIPYHKKGKRLLFLKSEIDEWLLSERFRKAKALENRFYSNDE